MPFIAMTTLEMMLVMIVIVIIVVLIVISLVIHFPVLPIKVVLVMHLSDTLMTLAMLLLIVICSLVMSLTTPQVIELLPVVRITSLSVPRPPLHFISTVISTQ